MPAVAVALAVAVAFFLGYRYYSFYLARRVYALDPAFVTPAHSMRDGVDYLPTNKHVLFGHHFTSVAGAAPIVGPAIAVFWGWLPALLWVVIGTIFGSGAHDFGSIVVSVRHRAQSVGTLAKDVINRRARTLFLLIIFFLLTLVNAVFAVVIANLFVARPEAVLPILLEIPIAIAVGQYIYRSRSAALVPSIIGVVVLYLTIPLGMALPISLGPVAEALNIGDRSLWVVLLFAYTFVASRIPVWVLLQPRDYINSHQLFIALAVIALGVVVGMDRIVAPAINDVPEGSPHWFPFLFITIACGAISGFHSLVSSGTTSKQLDKETDARHVGYFGSLGEGSLAVGSILACTAGLAASTADWERLYVDFGTASGGATNNFVEGVASFASNLGVPMDMAVIFAAIVVISFAATTMDTGVRLQRYVIQEIAQIVGVRKIARNLTVATSIAVGVPLIMALLPGGDDDAGYTFGVLWQLFGTTNQLTAGLALAVIAVWVTRNRRNPIAVLVPLVFLLAMTSWALVINLRNFVSEGEWVLAPLDAIIFVLAVWLIIEAVLTLYRAWSSLGVEAEPTAAQEPDSTSHEQ